jgi:hypothetical protein
MAILRKLPVHVCVRKKRAGQRTEYILFMAGLTRRLSKIEKNSIGYYMKNWLKGIILIIVLTAQLPAMALTLHVSPKGKDSNPGTAAYPLASLTGARDRLRQLRNAGKLHDTVVVLVAAGEYYMNEPLTLTDEDGGTKEKPVVYKSLVPGSVTFYGGMKLPAFTDAGGGIWKTYIPEVTRYHWLFEQLYINGKRAQRAKFPNEGVFALRTVTEKLIDSGKISETRVQKILLLPEQVTLFKSLPAAVWEEAVVNFYHKWNSSRRKNLRFSAADSALYMVSGPIIRVNRIDTNTLYSVENLYPALDTPGEWWLRPDGWLYYMPRPGEQMQAINAMAPVNDEFIIIRGKEEKLASFIHFENLAFKVAGYQMPHNGDYPKQSAAFTGATIMVNHASHIYFTNCEVAHTSTNAIWFQKNCSQSKVEHCYLHDLGAGAVKMGEVSLTGGQETVTNHITVQNCIVRSGGHVFASAAALVIFHASDNQLLHNDISDFRYSGISAGWVWGYQPSVAKRNKIEYNHIHHLGWALLSDMGGVYTLGQSEGTTVSNNVIHHVYSATYGGWGLYTDEGSSGITLENNLVYACKSGGFHQNYGRGNLVRNNIFASHLRAQLEAGRIELHEGFSFTNNIVYYSSGELRANRWEKVTSKVDSNCYWDTRTTNITLKNLTFKEWQQKGKDLHSIIEDPGFANTAAFDFTLPNTAVAAKIGFRPFDYSKAGVYGDSRWKQLALLPPDIETAFNQACAEREKVEKK